MEAGHRRRLVRELKPEPALHFLEKIPSLENRITVLFQILIACILLVASTAWPNVSGASAASDSHKRTGKQTSTCDAEGKWCWKDPSPGRLIASPTAFLQKKGTLSFNFSTFLSISTSPVGFHFFDVTYGINENFDIQGGIIFPLYYLGFGLYPKFSMPLGKYVRVGLIMDLAVVMPYNPVGAYEFVGCEEPEEHVNYCRPWFIVGGAPFILTVGSVDYHLNLSTHVLFYRGVDDNCATDVDFDVCSNRLHHHIISVSSFGVSVRIAKGLKLNVEVLYVFKHNFTDPLLFTVMRHLIFPMIGLKIIGKKFHGSINLVGIILNGTQGWGSYLHYVFPLFSFGFIYP